jgi:hypothetical protein
MLAPNILAFQMISIRDSRPPKPSERKPTSPADLSRETLELRQLRKPVRNSEDFIRLDDAAKVSSGNGRRK